MRRFLASIPFLDLNQALVVCRVSAAVFFGAHALVRISNGSIPRFAAFMESVGFPSGIAVVWCITMVEIAAATFLLLNRNVRLAAGSLLTIAAGGIVLIHARQGWFVGEHGTGGVEYSAALIVILLVTMAADRPAQKATE